MGTALNWREWTDFTEEQPVFDVKIKGLPAGPKRLYYLIVADGVIFLDADPWDIVLELWRRGEFDALYRQE